MRKTLTVAGVAAVSTGAVILAAGAAQAKTGLHLSVDHHTVQHGRTVTFRADAFSDSSGDKIHGLKLCLQRALPKGPGYERLLCTTHGRTGKSGAERFTLTLKPAVHKGTYTFRAVAYRQDRNHHWHAWGAGASNLVKVTVR
ncbi:hypothetical protein GCM10029978_054270 [Actinoallomurus acanthiterrae]